MITEEEYREKIFEITYVSKGEYENKDKWIVSYDVPPIIHTFDNLCGSNPYGYAGDKPCRVDDIYVNIGDCDGEEEDEGIFMKRLTGTGKNINNKDFYKDGINGKYGHIIRGSIRNCLDRLNPDKKFIDNDPLYLSETDFSQFFLKKERYKLCAITIHFCGYRSEGIYYNFIDTDPPITCQNYVEPEAGRAKDFRLNIRLDDAMDKNSIYWPSFEKYVDVDSVMRVIKDYD